MTQIRDSRRRRPLRLRDYDYSQDGACFATICTQNRGCCFGEVADGVVGLNEVGEQVRTAWSDMPARFPGIAPIPNAGCTARQDQGAMNRAPTLGDIVRAFKAVSTHTIRRSLNPVFSWRRNYYEQVIRSEADLNRVRQYIMDNPAQWSLDRENRLASPPFVV